MEWIDFNMGCLTGDSLLYMNPGGLIRIDSIKPGEHVYGLDFATMQPRQFTVKALQKMGIKKVYEVMVEGRTIRATDNHPFLVLSRENRLGAKNIGTIKYFTVRWKHLADITRDDFVAYVQRLPDEGKPYKINYSYEPRGRAHYLKYELVDLGETTEKLLWLLGVYIGDGCSERVSDKVWRRLSFAVPPQDRIRGKLTKVLRELFGVQPRSHGISLTLPSTAVASLFAHLGLGGNARTKRIPGWVFGLPLSQRLAFIEGCLDSDGHVHKTSHQMTFTSVSYQLARDLQLLAISCGLKTYKIRHYKIKRKLPLGKEKKFYDHYQFCISKHDLESIRSHRVVYRHAREFVGFAKPSSVRFVGVEDVYDIEVEGGHNFIANGLLVHNSKLTMKYPSFILAGKGARGETLSMALAGAGQHQDTGSKAHHLAPYTTSTIMAKSISKDGGRTSYRGMVTVAPQAKGSKSKVVCDALILDPESRSDTYPTNRILCDDVSLEHEATVSRIGEEQLFYLMSRGLTEEEASKMIVSGFVEPLVKKLPLEYAVEMNRLIDLEMEGSVG
ncbi:MAG: SufD family Fe-S cluster assembly protein [Candidatus Chisholmbacteria bacterium]|nr:SufD family Fe-S cluster assembly protein [Candidatus Chisholmbacteria bacterium]